MDALREAIRIAGGGAALARQLGVSKQAVLAWTYAPAQRLREIERLTGISRRALRPDLFPARPVQSSRRLARYWQTRRAFVEALESTRPEDLGMSPEMVADMIAGIEVPWLQDPTPPPKARQREQAAA
jgi:DNA-binding transcriptional regulator YdaS (Cro superfamily)